MAELADERGGLAATRRSATSPEKQLQLETYARGARRPSRAPGATTGSDDAFVRELRERYGVTGDEHAAVLDRLLQSRDGVARHLGDVPAAIEWSAAASEPDVARDRRSRDFWCACCAAAGSARPRAWCTRLAATAGSPTRVREALLVANAAGRATRALADLAVARVARRPGEPG